MKEAFDDSKALLANAGAQGLYTDLLLQLGRDFARAGLDLHPGDLQTGGEPSPETLVQILRERIYRLLLEDFEGYLNLMYAADVPEREFRNLALTDAVEVADQIVYILLVREWKKVCYRKSSGQK